VLAGAAIVPAAPILVPGMSATLPHGVGEVRAAVETALRAATDQNADLTILVAAGTPAGAYASAEASMQGFGRPDLARTYWTASRDGHAGPLPPGLAVLALLVDEATRPVLPLAVDPGRSAEGLEALGADLASRPGRSVVIASGDCSAGLDERSPRWCIEGAAAWDRQLVAAVAAGDRESLAKLGPEEARRVVALGWAPIVVAQAAIGGPFQVRSYSAPRGVGYLIAEAVTDEGADRAAGAVTDA
jgi:hypothetical protein